jgi:hypothetical protein
MSHDALILPETDVVGASPWLLAVRDELASLGPNAMDEDHRGPCTFKVFMQERSLWIVVEFSGGGGVALRAAYCLEGEWHLREHARQGAAVQVDLGTSFGNYCVTIDLPTAKQPWLHWRTSLVPSVDLICPYWPADLYPFDQAFNPLNTRGIIHAAQKGPKGALLYGTLSQPSTGSFLYLQNLTELNRYFEQTETSPDSRISGRWPELGFLLPPSCDKALPAAEEVVVSDAWIMFSDAVPSDDRQGAKLFLDFYSQLYLALPKPEPMHRNWPSRVEATIRDLTHSPECSVEKHGCRYLLAYVGADDRPPESMVQLAVLVPMIEYVDWYGDGIPLIEQLRDNLPTFYNDEIRTVVRWLPTEAALLQGKEEHMGERVMDAWYLYHTYLNLSRLAEHGDAVARRLFLDSIDYGIKVARHFNYDWPVFYDTHTLEVIKAETRPGAGGEHDVGAQYVHLMMQAWTLTGERRFIDEAEGAAQALVGLGFDLGYQFNNTSFGAGGLLRLWKETGKDLYRDLSYVCLANIVRNFWLWECDYGYAKHYHTFLGLPPLQDAPYLAMYEELEVLAAIHDYLCIAPEEIPASLRVLLCEYCKYLIDRAWYHYPSELPQEVLAEQSQSGHINRELAIPLEDLYEGWQKAGAVGQEIYGASAPFVFSTRHCHCIDDVHFIIHCNYPVRDFTIRRRRGRSLQQAGSVSFHILGDGRCRCHVRIVPNDYLPLPGVTVRAGKGSAAKAVEGVLTAYGYLEYELPGHTFVTVGWEEAQQRHSKPAGEKTKGKRKQMSGSQQAKEKQRTAEP